MSVFIEEKITIWGRYSFNESAPIEKIKEKLEEGCTLKSLCTEEFGFIGYEKLDETIEQINPEDNEGYPTIEFLDEDTEETLWHNGTI